VEVSSTEEKRVRSIGLLFHDVIGNGNADSSGFSGAAAGRYKLEMPEFQAHCQKLAHVVRDAPIKVIDAAQVYKTGRIPILLTFDDGGVSAIDVADVLGRYEWYGHFFITTGCIGRSSFVSENQIRELARRGHVIGTHSRSHPERMSYLSRDQLLEEWSSSTKRLSEILGTAITVASVPGGYYSKRVAEAASLAGIKALFTSEPITTCRVVNGCLVLGRFTIWHGMGPEVTLGFVSERWPRVRQWVFWNSKKCAKVLGGRLYSDVRKYLTERPVSPQN
jgi:peptidoglycan/xylan/chitin deacetylase (PgdA/CDA1 family)